MCGGAGGYGSESSGPKGYDYSPNYVKNLTKAIESNLANNNAGVRSGGGALYVGGGSPYGPGGNSPSPTRSINPVPSGNGPQVNNPNGGGYTLPSGPWTQGNNPSPSSNGPQVNNSGGYTLPSGPWTQGNNQNGGIGSFPTPNVSGGRYDYVGAPAPQLPGSPTQFGPRGGAPLAGTGINYDPAVTKAAIAIQGFEGFVPKAFMDPSVTGKTEPKARVGWSSDTITDPITGKERPVTINDTISVEDANVDLNARIVGIQNTLAEKIGQVAWDNLSTGAKAAMTSVGYHYGSVPKTVIEAARSGNPETISKSISDLPINPGRRAEEAKISLSDKFINAGLNVLPGLVNPYLGLANFASGVVGGNQFSDFVRGSGDETITRSDPGSNQNQNQEIGYGPYGNLTREQYRDQYGGRDQVQEAPKSIISAITPPAAVAATTPVTTPAITPQGKTAPVAPGTTPNTRKLSDEEYAALSPLEKAYYDMGISTYGTFTPEYNYFPNRQPVYLREPDKENKKRNGGLVKGPGTETSDSVPALIGGKTPAALSDGEFVFTGRAVRGMGNGDRMEGARKLHQMMKKAEGNANKGGSRK